MMNPKILVTGGAGYIGSHTCVELISAGLDLVVIDNLSNSKIEAINRVETVCGHSIDFHQIDVRDREKMSALFRKNNISAVVHFAGLKAVAESVEKPLEYYDVNVAGSVVLLETMIEHGVKTLVFSSSATVYGEPKSVPIAEHFPLSATNPYGRSKVIVEDILRDCHKADKTWRIALLRYFNPVGAHSSGLIGEAPRGEPNNLMPILCQVAMGKRKYLSVYGNDYPTRDGTGIRDFIHVVDLALGHVKALQVLRNLTGIVTVNLGTGNGFSVLEIVRAFERVIGRTIPLRIVPRRPGDIAECFANCELALEALGWRAVKTLDDMCGDAWNWQSRNPNGY